MSKRLQNVFVVCAMVLAITAWMLVAIFQIAPCANTIKEAGYEDAYRMIWSLTRIIGCVVGAVIGMVGSKLLSQINGWGSKDQR